MAASIEHSAVCSAGGAHAAAGCVADRILGNPCLQSKRTGKQTNKQTNLQAGSGRGNKQSPSAVFLRAHVSAHARVGLTPAPTDKRMHAAHTYAHSHTPTAAMSAEGELFTFGANGNGESVARPSLA